MSDPQDILNQLRAVKGVHGAAIIEKMGLVRDTALPGWIDADSVAAMVTLIQKASERATKELQQGQFIRAIIESEKGKLLFSEIEGKIVVVIATADVKLGVINLKLDAARAALTNM
jgi:hypothetical protein